MKNLVLGLDIGITSVGYGVIDLDDGRFVDYGVRLFKEGTAEENLKRRTARSRRRLLTRRKTRISDMKNVLKEYHDLSFFFNNLLFNMNSTDALDLSSYIDKRCQFFQNDCFKEFDQITPIANFNDNLICVERVIEEPGLETPFILEFTIEIDNKIYQLPLVRFAIDNDNVCHLFAVQYGRYRDFGVQDCEYKKEVNKINKGVKKYRNVPPSFVLSLRLFLDLLKSYNIDQIVIPDFLFSRYKNYYKASTTGRSDDILSRILEDFLNLMQRMEYQFDDVEIEYYPNEIDGFTHISLNNEKKKKLSNK